MRGVAFVVVLFALLVAAVARADEPSRADLERAADGTGDPAAEALFTLAQLDERDLEMARALARYKESLARSPSSRYAQRASTRASWLSARAEGDFVPLVRLERVRRDPAQANDPAAIDALARDAEAFPPGTVRVEAWMLVAEAWVGRMNRHADAVALFRRVVADPKTDPLTARQAAREIVETAIADGRLDAAVAAAHELSTRLDPAFVTSVERQSRRRAIHAGATGVVAVFVALVAVALALAKRRARADAVTTALRAGATSSLAFAAFVGVAGSVLASQYEAGNAKPFLLFAAAVAPLALGARLWGAAGAQGRAARLARALVSAAATVAAAFLVLERVDPVYLEGFGL